MASEPRFIEGPDFRNNEDIAAWLQKMITLRKEVRDKFPVSDAYYERKDLKWVRQNLVSHFVFLWDAEIYDVGKNRYRTKEFIRALQKRYGGCDSILLWTSYPQVGIDQRNQFDFWKNLPGGLPALKRLCRDAHALGVKVFLPYQPWDKGTREEPMGKIAAIAELVVGVEADGVFLDTMSGGTTELREELDKRKKGIAFESEACPSDENLSLNIASWGQFYAYRLSPNIHRARWLEPRHVHHVVNRIVRDRTRDLQDAFFNGTGVIVWENVFGCRAEYTPRNCAMLRRMRLILKFAGNLLYNPDWQPYYPMRVRGAFASCWPGKDRSLWTIVNTRRNWFRAALPLMEVPHSENRLYYDLWNGRELEVQPKDGKAEIFLELEPYGLGCLLTMDKNAADKNLSTLLKEQRKLAQKTLESIDNRELITVPESVPLKQSRKRAGNKCPPEMMRIPAGNFTMKIHHSYREPSCYPDPGTDKKTYAWIYCDLDDMLIAGGEHTLPYDETTHRIGPVKIKAFCMDKYEVTNRDFREFIAQSGYKPACPVNFLKHWRDGKCPEELLDHPVVYVGREDARAYAKWAGKRLPTEMEWQYTAQGLDNRHWPWGGEFDAIRCNGDSPGTTPVDKYPSGASPFGVMDMCGNVWEWVGDEWSDGHTRFTVLRGGSFFQVKGSKWYFAGGAQPNDCHAKFLLMYPGLDRSATVGFRCVLDV